MFLCVCVYMCIFIIVFFYPLYFVLCYFLSFHCLIISSNCLYSFITPLLFCLLSLVLSQICDCLFHIAEFLIMAFHKLLQGFTSFFLIFYVWSYLVDLVFSLVGPNSFLLLLLPIVLLIFIKRTYIFFLPALSLQFSCWLLGGNRPILAVHVAVSMPISLLWTIPAPLHGLNSALVNIKWHKKPGCCEDLYFSEKWRMWSEVILHAVLAYVM